MKTKRIKLIIAGLLAFAVVLTGGSFGDVKSVKAYSPSSGGGGGEWISGSITLRIPVESGSLGDASNILSASASAFDYETDAFNISVF